MKKTFLVVATLAVAGFSFGQTDIFDNWAGPGQQVTYSNSYSFGYTDPNFPTSQYSLGEQFVPTQTGIVTNVVAAIQDATANAANSTPGAITLSIFSDNPATGNNTPTPNMDLGDFTVQTGMNFGDLTGAVTSMTNSNLLLTAGTTYWLVATAVTPDNYSWDQNPNLSVQGVTSGDNVNWNQAWSGGYIYPGYMEVDANVQAAPEPAGIMMLAFGALPFLKRRTSRR